ncbi:MAG: hypothetical protein AVDCRST_MAG28-2209, partial [uncultured Rubrobacteraceae bacterium]
GSASGLGSTSGRPLRSRRPRNHRQYRAWGGVRRGPGTIPAATNQTL